MTETTSTSRSKGAPPWMVLTILTAIYALNLMDRQLLPILAQAIKAEFALSDTQLGLLSGIVFAAFYMTVAIPIAKLADRANRVRIVAAACALWSLFTAISGASINALMLVLARIGVGIGEAGGAAPSYSLISDYFPPQRRGLAMAVFNLGFPIGIGCGIAIAGSIAAVHGWRTAFYVAAAPGLVMSILLLVLVREPTRGRLDGAASSPQPSVPLMTGILQYLRTPVLLRTTVATSLTSFVFLGLLVWAPTYLIRVRGMDLGEVGKYYSVTNAISMALGLWLGGYLAQVLVRRGGERMYALVSMGGVLVAAPTLVIALLADAWPVALGLLMLPTLFGLLYLGPATALVQNASAPDQRSLFSAIYMFCGNIVGQGGGPLFVGLVSDALTPSLGQQGLTVALILLAPVYLMAAGAYYWTSRVLGSRSPATGASEGRQPS